MQLNYDVNWSFNSVPRFWINLLNFAALYWKGRGMTGHLV